MKRSQALPGKFLAKEDFSQPVLAQVANVALEEIESNSGPAERKPVLYIMGPSNPAVDTNRGIILNGTNWDALEASTGKDDADEWPGEQIVIYHDPEVRFGNQKVGGIRIRPPQQQAAPAPPPAPPEPSTAQDAAEIPF